MTDHIIIADAETVPMDKFIRFVLGPKPGPTAAEKLCLSRLNRTVEERRKAFAERMERRGVTVAEDELLRMFPEPLTEVTQLRLGRIAA